MKVVLFGATGMVGQGVLRECLLDPEVEQVLSVGRTATGQRHDKLREIIRADLLEFSGIETSFSGYDACFFCLGISSLGMTAADYRRITYDLTLAAARLLVRLNPGMTFIYVSGSGTDSTERGRVMWARVKGETENAIRALPFRASYMFRPGVIQPLHGVRSKTRLYQTLYTGVKAILPLMKRIFPKYLTTTEEVGRAMLHVAKHGYAKPILENRDISTIGSPAAPT
jgi:uncharacterized protein YbjT (DUF2867 family)